MPATEHFDLAKRLWYSESGQNGQLSAHAFAMLFASLPMLIAASPALVAMLFIPLASAAPQASVARTVAAYVSYRPVESKVTAARSQTARRPAAASRPFALSIASAQRRMVALNRPSRASALFSLFLPFPNAPRAP